LVGPLTKIQHRANRASDRGGQGNLIEAWGRNAAYHFVFTRQNRGKLDALTTLVERGLVKPVIGATLPLARMGEAHELLENRRSYALRGKVAIDVAGETVALPPRIS
jgi:NADPH:quinone reductase-like Zn-dependent oxidoreductase